MSVDHGTFLLEQLKRAIEGVKLARKAKDELLEIEAMAKLDLQWAALMNQRRRGS